MLQERSTAAVGGERGGVGLLIVMVVNSGKCLVERDGSCDLVTGISGELQLRPESSEQKMQQHLVEDVVYRLVTFNTAGTFV